MDPVLRWVWYGAMGRNLRLKTLLRFTRVHPLLAYPTPLPQEREVRDPTYVLRFGRLSSAACESNKINGMPACAYKPTLECSSVILPIATAYLSQRKSRCKKLIYDSRMYSQTSSLKLELDTRSNRDVPVEHQQQKNIVQEGKEPEYTQVEKKHNRQNKIPEGEELIRTMSEQTKQVSMGGGDTKANVMSWCVCEKKRREAIRSV